MKLSEIYILICEYVVHDDHLSEFVKIFTPGGDWAKMLQKCPGYIKTELKKDIDNPNRFLTIDYWQSLSEYSAMKESLNGEYDRLSELCETYTRSDNYIGFFRNA